ncbi:MAG TPA: hypothetical protein PKZ22_14640 [Accumulibacter sp.]|jgi:hypothetical protein|nr:hypothetical protein [Accumulibacter sp.]
MTEEEFIKSSLLYGGLYCKESRLRSFAPTLTMSIFRACFFHRHNHRAALAGTEFFGFDSHQFSEGGFPLP